MALNGDSSISISEEEQALETAGGIKKAIKLPWG